MRSWDIPFYMQVARVLRREIISGKFPADKKFPDEDELASRFDVSKDVIRVSLRLLAKEDLLVRIRSKGTFVKDSGASQGLQTVLFTTFQNLIAFSILRQGIEKGIGDRNYSLSVKSIDCNDIKSELAYFKSLQSRNFAAMVLSPAVDPESDADNADTFKSLLEEGIPLLFVDRQIKDIPADMVYFDNKGSMFDAVSSIMDKGFRNFVFFSIDSRQRVAQERNSGVIEALRNSGVPLGKGNLIMRPFPRDTETDTMVEDLFSTYSGSSIEPEVIITLNDGLAWGIFQRLRKAGLHNKIKLILAVADLNCGDAEFKSILHPLYRLYDEFAPAISDILNCRFEGAAPEGLPILKSFKYKHMSHSEAQTYFQNKASADGNSF